MAKFNICLVKPENYVHSYAFLELGELIHYSLKALNHDSTLAFNSTDSSSINILIGCHLLNPSLIPQIPKSTIILNTEQIYSDTTSWNDNIFRWAEKFTIWDYSNRNIEKFNQLGISHTKHFKIGYQKELTRLHTNTTKEIDVLFYGCINDRRKAILDGLVNAGLNVKVLFGVYGKERDHWIEKSKIVLNHHFYNSQIFEIVRVFYLISNSIPVVAEVNDTTSIETIYLNSIRAENYNNLIQGCLTLTLNTDLRKSLAIRSMGEFINHPQQLFTREALE